MTDLAELLERVKAATGPDRRLDLDICAALGTLEYGPTSRGWTRHPHPELTASLDTALALVERVLPEMEFSISMARPRKGWAVKTWLTDDKYSGRLFDAVTPALALLAALLSALIAQAASSDVGSADPRETP